MNFFSYLRVETGRLFREKNTWLVILVTMICPLAGYGIYQPAGTSTTASVALANPVLAGGLGGAILFAILTLLEFDRVYKARTDALTHSIASPILLSVVKLGSMLAATLAAVLFTAVAYLPYTIYRMDVVFRFGDYLNCFFLLMLPSLWLAILAASAFYQIFRRIDLSFVLFVVFTFFSLSTWCADEYLLRWINPLVPILSSDFSNGVVFRTAGYSRLLWFVLLIGLWLLSLLCVRNHGKGLFGSFVYNARRVYVPVAAVSLICSAVFLYASEPYIDHSPMRVYDAGTGAGEMAVSVINPYVEQNPDLILLDTRLSIDIDAAHSKLKSTAVYQLKNSSGQPQECILQMNPGYSIGGITANGIAVNFKDKKNDHDQMKDIVCPLPADSEIMLEVTYSGHPKIWSKVRAFFSGPQIEKDYVNLGGIHLRPVINATPGGKAGLSGEITLPDNLVLVSTGESAKVLCENNNGTKTWQVHSLRGNVSLFAGDYMKLKIEGGGMPIYFYYSQKHQKQMEELGIKRVLEDTIAYCTEQYGLLPYKEEEPLGILQSSAYMFGGGVSGNLSVMDEACFSKEGLVNPQKGSNSAEVMAHEIIHQWWGNSAYCMDMENLNWTNEGVTVYTTYRLMKEKHGEDYAKKNYVDVWKALWKDQNSNFYVRNPEYLNILPEKYISRLQTQISSINTYSNMALKIYKAARLVGGEEKMDAILAGLYKNSKTKMPPYITWHDFLNACGLTEEDLNIDENI